MQFTNAYDRISEKKKIKKISRDTDSTNFTEFIEPSGVSETIIYN